MTNDECMDLLRGDSPLNKARQQFSNWYAKIEQDSQQRSPSGPVEIRKMEFEAVQAIAKALSIDLC